MIDNPLEHPRSFRASILWKLSAFLVVSLLVSSFVQLYFSTRGWRILYEQLEQESNWNAAAEFALRLQPLVKDRYEPEAVERVIFSLASANPKLDFLILDAAGKVLHSIPFREPVHRETIALGPILEALQPKTPVLPLYGDDPFSDNGGKIFSVAPLVVGGKDGFLYIPLTSNFFDFLIRKTGQFYIFRTILLGVFVSTAVAILIGFFLSIQLRRRFRSMSGTISAFQRGNYLERIPESSPDEIGQLSAAFNSMAETIVRNIDELKRKDGLRRELIANISHDLRGPVTAIIGYLETILEYKASPDELKKYLSIVYENALVQKAMVEDLFHLASLEANEQAARKDFVGLHYIVKNVAESLQPALDQKRLRLEMEVPESLPKVFVDAAMIQRVFLNLLSNAVRYTPAGGSVRIAATENGVGALLVTVSDTGIGIPESEIPHVFESFYRANKHRPEDPGGTGLGLTIVKRILALHQSVPTLVSQENEGSAITFALSTVES